MNDDVAAGVDDALRAWTLISGEERPDVRVFSFDCCHELKQRHMSDDTFFVGGVSQPPAILAEEAVQAFRVLLLQASKAQRRPLRPELEIKGHDVPIPDPA